MFMPTMKQTIDPDMYIYPNTHTYIYTYMQTHIHTYINLSGYQDTHSKLWKLILTTRITAASYFNTFQKMFTFNAIHTYT